MFNSEKLGVDRTIIGLSGSPTIVYDVQRVPAAKATRHAEVLDPSPENIRKVVAKMREALAAMVTK